MSIFPHFMMQNAIIMLRTAFIFVHYKYKFDRKFICHADIGVIYKYIGERQMKKIEQTSTCDLFHLIRFFECGTEWILIFYPFFSFSFSLALAHMICFYFVSLLQNRNWYIRFIAACNIHEKQNNKQSQSMRGRRKKKELNVFSVTLEQI